MASGNISMETGLNSVQISLLKLFAQKISDRQSLEIRQMLMDYFDKQLKEELNEITSKKGYTDLDYKNMLNAST